MNSYEIEIDLNVGDYSVTGIANLDMEVRGYHDITMGGDYYEHEIVKSELSYNVYNADGEEVTKEAADITDEKILAKMESTIENEIERSIA